MGRNYSDNLHSIKNTGENLTLKRMFDISEKLIVGQSHEIFGVSQISWENSPGKQLSLVNDEEVISLSHAQVYVFSDSVLCLGKMNRNRTSTTVWERQLEWFKESSHYRTLDTNALADEDHTHHLTPQEYYHYKSNWWLRSNKKGSNTVPVELRPDFKQAVSTLQQLKQKEEGAQRNQQWAQSSSSSSWWSWQGS